MIRKNEDGTLTLGGADEVEEAGMCMYVCTHVYMYYVCMCMHVCVCVCVEGALYRNAYDVIIRCLGFKVCCDKMMFVALIEDILTHVHVSSCIYSMPVPIGIH